jgi:hypothetical protein
MILSGRPLQSAFWRPNCRNPVENLFEKYLAAFAMAAVHFGFGIGS